MVQLVSVQEVEATINRVRREKPPINGRLSPELNVLAEIYGNMIYARAQSVDLDQLAENIRPAAIQLLGNLGPEPSVENGNKVCSYGPDAEACEVCQ